MATKEEVDKAYDAAKAAAWDDAKAAARAVDEAWDKYVKLKREYDNENQSNSKR